MQSRLMLLYGGIQIRSNNIIEVFTWELLKTAPAGFAKPDRT